MAWTWVNDLFAPREEKKSMYWDARCPYHGCPSNEPFRGAHKPRLKFMQKLGTMIYQYKCRDCGNLVDIDCQVPAGQPPVERLLTHRPFYKT